MAKQVSRYESDGETPAASSYDEGTVKDGEQTTPRRLWWKNTSTNSEVLESCQFRRAQVGANDGYTMLEIAPDVEGQPGEWQTAAISIGDMAVDDMAACWMRYNVPAGKTQVGNPRRAYVQFEEA
jgi:hypothetical protein